MEKIPGNILERFRLRIIALFIITALSAVFIMALVYLFIPDYSLLFARADGASAHTIRKILMEVTLIAAIASTMVGAFIGFMLAKSVTIPVSFLLSATGGLMDISEDIKKSSLHQEYPSTFSDITDSIVKATDKLSFIKDSADQIVSSMEDALAIVDSKHRIMAVNMAFLGLTGYGEQGEVVGKNFELILEEKNLDEPLLSRTEREGRLSGVESFYIAQGGTRIPVSVSASVLREKNKTERSVIILAKDLREKNAIKEELSNTRAELTKRVYDLEDFREGILTMLRNLDRNEKELEEAYLKLKETHAQLVQSTKLMALGELAAGLAHEMNQPLTVIRGISQHLIKKVKEGSPECEELKIIDDATRKMEKVINHLRVFSRLDEQELKPTDLNRVIEDAFIMINELMKKNSIAVEFSLSPIPPVMGCANRLEQVVINLATNARDAMPDGGRLRIKTGCVEECGKKHVCASFEDTGCGIHPDIVDRIFEPFFTTKDIDRGTGLGLSITYGIIKDHKGDIRVKSKVGNGTTFSVTIPSCG